MHTIATFPYFVKRIWLNYRPKQSAWTPLKICFVDENTFSSVCLSVTQLGYANNFKGVNHISADFSNLFFFVRNLSNDVLSSSHDVIHAGTFAPAFHKWWFPLTFQTHLRHKLRQAIGSCGNAVAKGIKSGGSILWKFTWWWLTRVS